MRAQHLPESRALINETAIYTCYIFVSIPLGYEIIGLEKIPDNGSALLVYYHGALPIDMYYILAKMLLYKRRPLKNVVATFLYRFPGIHS